MITIQETINGILIWLLNALVFYYILLLLGGAIGFLIQGIKHNIVIEGVIIAVAIGISLFLTSQIMSKLKARLNALSFRVRLVVTIGALLLLAITLSLIINVLPDRI